MIEAEEMIVAVLSLVFVVAIFVQFRSLQMRELTLFVAGAILLFAASGFIVLERVGWEDAFNLMEHLCYASAGICFAMGCCFLGRRFRNEQGGQV